MVERDRTRHICRLYNRHFFENLYSQIYRWRNCNRPNHRLAGRGNPYRNAAISQCFIDRRFWENTICSLSKLFYTKRGGKKQCNGPVHNESQSGSGTIKIYQNRFLPSFKSQPIWQLIIGRQWFWKRRYYFVSFALRPQCPRPWWKWRLFNLPGYGTIPQSDIAARSYW